MHVRTYAGGGEGSSMLMICLYSKLCLYLRLIKSPRPRPSPTMPKPERSLSGPEHREIIWDHPFSRPVYAWRRGRVTQMHYIMLAYGGVY